MKLIIDYRSVLLSICGMGWGVETAHAGAWTLPKGDGQIISTFEISSASTAFSDEEPSELSFSKTVSRIYAEHGLTDKVTLVFNGAHQTLGFQDEQTDLSFSDFDDIEIGARYRLGKGGRDAWAVQASYIIGGGPARSVLDVDGNADSVELRGIWGRSHDIDETYGVFIDVQNALRLEGGVSVSEYRNEFTVGLKRKKRLALIGQLLRTEVPSETDRGFTVPVTRQLKATMAIAYEYKKNRNFQIGYVETVDGRNIVRERGVSFSTVYRY